MAECDWIILSDYAFVAEPSKISMVGVFNAIYSDSVPAIHKRAFVSYNLVGEPGEEITAKLEIIAPSGNVIAEQVRRSTLPDSGGWSALVEVEMLRLEEFGMYAIQLDVGDGHPKQAWFKLIQRRSGSR